ncbi:hypothetical protein BJ508DRAFT_325588 [Ascobolus immersus RN42]|uniref:DUF7918 domain-containing protein n=1 Tax=Ascobolus immersus RN42 TaxID=1160509 RepID=A0A3N4ICD2_ASCIM|nr:hypothetical protein BJ508DRAFT_325588 [Ascobolus immersus RN42]
MVVHNNFDFSILSPTKGRLPEYPFTGEEPTPYTKTVYVQVPDSPSHAPQPFHIRIKSTLPTTTYTQSHYGHLFTLALDGFTSSTGACIAPEYPCSFSSGVLLTDISIACADGKSSVSKGMRFEPLQLSLSCSGDEEINPKLGTIELGCKELTALAPWKGRLVSNKGRLPGGAVGKAGIVGVEGLSHVTSIGEELPGVIRPGFECVSKVGAPWWTVRYIYRSRAALVSMGVIGNSLDEPSVGCGLGLRRLFKRMFKKKVKKVEKQAFSSDKKQEYCSEKS